MEVVGEVYIHEIEVLHDSCKECSKILPRTCWSMHVSDHVTNTVTWNIYFYNFWLFNVLLILLSFITTTFNFISMSYIFSTQPLTYGEEFQYNL
jgi:hypothetical protein